jgi:hypothetical protein
MDTVEHVKGHHTEKETSTMNKILHKQKKTYSRKKLLAYVSIGIFMAASLGVTMENVLSSPSESMNNTMDKAATNIAMRGFENNLLAVQSGLGVTVPDYALVELEK